MIRTRRRRVDVPLSAVPTRRTKTYHTLQGRASAEGYALFRFFFFNDTATTEIYTLSLHDALPILAIFRSYQPGILPIAITTLEDCQDRKSTRLNSSHGSISYAVFCLKKQNYIVLYALIHSQQAPNSCAAPRVLPR